MGWLVGEWARAQSYVAKMQHHVPSLYTYRYNLFDNIGEPGAFVSSRVNVTCVEIL